MNMIDVPIRELLPLHTITATEITNQAVGISGPDISPQIYTHSTEVRIQYWGAQLASSSGTLTFETKLSYDNGATWQSGPSGASITLSTTAQAGQQTLDILPNQPTNCGHVLLMVLAVFGGTPGTPSVTYRADYFHDYV
jgi:hypothetical protein